MQKLTLPKGSNVREYYAKMNAATNNNVGECYAKANTAIKQQCARILYKSECCHKATVSENAM